MGYVRTGASGIDSPTRDAPAQHRIAFGHPAGLLVEALARGAVKGSLGVKVEWGRARRGLPTRSLARSRRAARRYLYPKVVMRSSEAPELPSPCGGAEHRHARALLPCRSRAALAAEVPADGR